MKKSFPAYCCWGGLGNKAFRDNFSLPVFLSISISFTCTSSPILKTFSTSSVRFQSISEMWSKPSFPGSISIKAPKGWRLRTFPVYTSPTSGTATIFLIQLIALSVDSLSLETMSTIPSSPSSSITIVAPVEFCIS